MKRENTATWVMIACMVASISTLPAMLIVGGLQPPTVTNRNYYDYWDQRTNVTITNMTVNGTIMRTPHFVNVTTTLNSTFKIIYSIPLANRTIVTSIVGFSYNQRPDLVGPSGASIQSRINGQVVYGMPFLPYFTIPTMTTQGYYGLWWNTYTDISYPNATGYTLDIGGSNQDTTWPSITVSIAIWWETW